MTRFSELPDFVLAPLAGRGEPDWFRTTGNAWSPGMIVEHLTKAIENSAGAFASRADKPPMMRRPRPLYQAVACHVVLKTGWFPPGRRAPETTRPDTLPDRAATEARMRAAVASFLDLERRLLPQRAGDLFVKHPVLGDLTLGEFMTFHVRHAEHHRKQIVRRLGEAAG